MKMKINKACDLSSISVLPPHTRRSNSVPNGPQASQFRSQPSEQSLSQGFSSQHGMFSQFSQNSLAEVLTNDQRFGSQERENAVKKISCLPPISHTREESQMQSMQISRSSKNPMRKWSSASVSDNRCQISEEFEHRIGMMETCLNKFGIILDSVQSDVMQVSRGTKEVSLEMEAIGQKLMVQDSSLQLLNKGQEEFKASLEGGIKSMSEKLSKITYEDKLQEIFLVLLALPEKIEASLLKSQNKLQNSFIKEIQKLLCNQKLVTPVQKCEAPSILPPKGAASRAIPQRKPQPIKISAVPSNNCVQAAVVPKTETGGWKSVKSDKAMLSDRASQKVQKLNRITSIRQERECRVFIESDEEIDGAFSCLLEEKETGVENYSTEEVQQETERILRRARRRKRKCCNPIIIN